jgi:hypothetical protein
MDHNNLEVINDFVAPLSEFLDNFAILTHNKEVITEIGLNAKFNDITNS